MNQSEKNHVETTRKRAPNWSIEPFEYFVEEAEYLRKIIEITHVGMSVLRAMPVAEQALMKASDYEPDRPDRIERIAELAQRELEAGFPIVNAQAVVSIWGFLEATVTSFLRAWLQNEPTAFEAKVVQRLKIRFGEYHKLDDYQKAEYVLSLLENELAVGLRNGVTRFEALLKPFGLSGNVPEEVRKDIYEMSQVRNVIAHRAGVVDHRFSDACPWIDVEIGHRFHVTTDMLMKYFDVAFLYVTRLICRVSEHFEVDMSEHREGLQESESVYKEKYRQPDD